MLTTVDREEPDRLERASHEIWMQIWNRDRDITNSAVLSEALVRAGIAESDSLKYVEMANEDEIESRLQNVTQEAIDARAFGAPTFILREDGEDDRLFFGQGIKNSPEVPNETAPYSHQSISSSDFEIGRVVQQHDKHALMQVALVSHRHWPITVGCPGWVKTRIP